MVSSTGYPHIRISPYITLPLPFLWAASSGVYHYHWQMFHRCILYRRIYTERKKPLFYHTSKDNVNNLNDRFLGVSAVKLHICQTLPDFITQNRCSYACMRRIYQCTYIEKSLQTASTTPPPEPCAPADLWHGLFRDVQSCTTNMYLWFFKVFQPFINMYCKSANLFVKGAFPLTFL